MHYIKYSLGINSIARNYRPYSFLRPGVGRAHELENH